jgi:large subunit ribosomal protein L18
MKRHNKKNVTRTRRTHGVRAHLNSASDKPRFSIYRSNQNLYVQIIDDAKGKTLASGTLKEVKSEKKKVVGARIERAFALGKLMAEKAKKAGVNKIVFDRGQYAYHGRIKALADGAREGGLKF